jgi:Ca-activated chloride channel family protein
MDGSAMQHALAAVRELIGELSIDDRFTLITYASGANELISLAHATPSARRAWTSTLDHVRAGGGTNMASGIDLATAAVDRTRAKGRVPRIILLSDGHANEGDSSRAGLLARAGRAAAGEYVLSAVGVADGFDESLMTALADAGTGNFYYVQRSEELGEVFAAEFASARETIASALEVSIDPAPGIEVVSAAGYPLDRQDRRVSFRPGALFSGQERRIWLTLRLPVTNVEVGPEDSLPLGAFSLSFIHGGERHTLRLAEEPRVARVQDEDAYFESVELSRWERSVEEEEVGELKLSVSKDIERGDRPGAMRKLGAFLSRQKAMNRRMQSPKVEEVISSVGEMALDVAGAFEADDAKMKLLLRKTYSAEGYDDRRPGAKY